MYCSNFDTNFKNYGSYPNFGIDISQSLTFEEAIRKAEIYCAYRERNTFEVKNKLLQLGITQEHEITKILKHLTSHNFLNEQRYIASYIQGKIKAKKWGKAKITAFLKSQKIERDSIETQLSLVDDIDYDNNLSILLLKKWKALSALSIPEKKSRCLRYALQKGYEYDKIMEILKNIDK